MGRVGKTPPVLFLLGVGFALIGVLYGHVILEHLITHANARRVLAPDSEALHRWSNTQGTGAADSLWKVYHFNVTNAENVSLHNAVPIVVEVGPYVYQEDSERFNITFTANHTRVNFSTRTSYTFRADLSGQGLSDSDRITNLGPTYLKAWPLVQDQANPHAALSTLAAASDAFLRVISAYAHVVCQTDPNPDPTALCYEAAAAQWGRLDGDAALLLNANESWSEDFRTMQIATNYDAELVQDLTALKTDLIFPEYAAFARSNPTRVQTTSFDPAVSRALLADTPSSEFPCPLRALYTAADQYQGFPCAAVLLQEDPSSPKAQALFGALSLAERQDLRTYLNATGAAFAQQTNTQDLSPWLTQSATEWTFANDDALARRLRLDANTAFFPLNDSSVDAAWRRSPFLDTIQTGADAPIIARAHVQWRGMSVLASKAGNPYAAGRGFCGGAQAVQGFDAAVFPASTSTYTSLRAGLSEDMDVWSPELQRAVAFSHTGSSKVRGIDTWTYAYNASLFQADPTLDMRYAGVMNMTCPNAGLPLWLTLPHFGHADLPAALLVQGVSPYNETLHGSTLQIDPTSGQSLSNTLRLQVNLEAASGVLATAAPARVVPALWTERVRQMSDAQRRDYSSILDALGLHRGLFLSGIVIGPLLVVLSFALLGKRCLVRHGDRRASLDVYHSLQTDTGDIL